jgi:hypothetical protein
MLDAYRVRSAFVRSSLTCPATESCAVTRWRSRTFCSRRKAWLTMTAATSAPIAHLP